MHQSITETFWLLKQERWRLKVSGSERNPGWNLEIWILWLCHEVDVILWRHWCSVVTLRCRSVSGRLETNSCVCLCIMRHRARRPSQPEQTPLCVHVSWWVLSSRKNFLRDRHRPIFYDTKTQWRRCFNSGSSILIFKKKTDQMWWDQDICLCVCVSQFVPSDS